MPGAALPKPAFAQSAYMGYVNQSTRDSALSWAIPQGSRDFLESKYRSIAPEQRGAVPDAEVKGASVYDLQYKWNVRPGDYHVPEPKLGLTVMPMHKPQVGVPEYASNYPDYRLEARLLRDVTDAAVDAAVREADAVQEGFVLAREVRMCIRTCLGGREPSSHLANLFNGYFAKRGLTRIMRDELAAAVRDAADYLDAELDCQSQAAMRDFRAARNRKPVPEADFSAAAAAAAEDDAHADAKAAAEGAERAEGGTEVEAALMSSSAGSRAGSGSKRLLTAGPLGVPEGLKGPPGLNTGNMRATALNSEAARRGMPIPIPPPGDTTVKNFRLQGPTPLSSYERDEGRYGSDPCERPTSEPNARGFPMTTRELNTGTTRTSRHLPGFMGHVPASTFGPAAEQGLGHGDRDSFLGHTNLNQTFTKNVPGYAGYAPTSAINQTLLRNIEIGAKAMNETARMQGSVQSMWAAVHAQKAAAAN